MGVCEHPTTELRARSTVSGSFQYARQCVACGQRVGMWVKRPDGDVPLWDWEAEQAVKSMNVTAAKAAYDARRESEQQLWWRVYERFLESGQWSAIRFRVLARAGRKCEACLVNTAQQVHHTTYPQVVLAEDMSAEVFQAAVMAALVAQPLYELRAVCRQCHYRIHPHMEAA
jgi:hypothetical protein